MTKGIFSEETKTMAKSTLLEAKAGATYTAGSAMLSFAVCAKMLASDHDPSNTIPAIIAASIIPAFVATIGLIFTAIKLCETAGSAFEDIREHKLKNKPVDKFMP